MKIKFSITHVIVIMLILSVGVSSTLFSFQLATWTIQKDIQQQQQKQLIEHSTITQKLIENALKHDNYTIMGSIQK